MSQQWCSDFCTQARLQQLQGYLASACHLIALLRVALLIALGALRVACLVWPGIIARLTSKVPLWTIPLLLVAVVVMMSTKKPAKSGGLTPQTVQACRQYTTATGSKGRVSMPSCRLRLTPWTGHRHQFRGTSCCCQNRCRPGLVLRVEGY